MDAFIRAIFEKIGILYLATTVFLTSGALLFLPLAYQEILMLQPFRDNYQWIIGPAFLVSAIYLIIAIVNRTMSYIRNGLNRRKRKSALLRKIKELSQDEFNVLSAFIDPVSKMVVESADLDYCDGRVKILESYCVIKRLASSGFGTMGVFDNTMSCLLPYMIHPIAKKELSEMMKRGQIRM